MGRKGAVAGAAVFAALAVLAGQGCASGHACPAVAWADTLTVEADGDTDRVDLLELCFAGHCMFDEDLPSDSPLSHLPYERVDENTWQFDFFADPPDEIEVRVLDADDHLLAESNQPLEWVVSNYPHGEECGGPGTAEVRIAVE
ncbi:hypothetical protein [uncultured Agrococcus sp.]|uniref:hypothetical protein n=1 Tax=uncultured Agrococcus sp. TaxID=382258 RepID=UPI0025E81D1F|nr:hypothetical protein [uncultured Agrococcus sp.]